MIAHIVLFSLKSDLSADLRRAFAKSADRTFSTVPSIRRASVGASLSINPAYERSMGDSTYDYAAIIEFDDEAGLLEYLNHPLHHELGRLFWECCSSTSVTEVRWLDTTRMASLVSVV